MGQAIIPYVIAAMALAMLVGGLAIIAHAVKTWLDERNLRSK